MKLIILIILSFAFFGCKKPANRKCWKGTGAAITEKLTTAGITKIKVYDDLNLNLIQDSLDYLEIKSYTNILPFIEIKKAADTLILRNTNRCDFIRNRDKRSVLNFHFSSLSQLFVYGTGEINSSDTIHGYSLKVYGDNATSNINLNVQLHSFTSALAQGNARINVTGTSNYANLSQSKYCITEAFGLTTKYAICSNISTGNIEVNALDSLSYSILNTGNVYYRNTPYVTPIKNIGLGELIKD